VAERALVRARTAVRILDRARFSDEDSVAESTVGSSAVDSPGSARAAAFIRDASVATGTA
jgi:hypothetical protein